MTYCKNGELLKWIKNVGNFDRKSAAFYSAEIVKALEHLHNLNIVHRWVELVPLFFAEYYLKLLKSNFVLYILQTLH